MMLWSDETLAVLRESKALRDQLTTMTIKLNAFEQRLRVVSEQTAHHGSPGEEPPRHDRSAD